MNMGVRNGLVLGALAVAAIVLAALLWGVYAGMEAPADVAPSAGTQQQSAPPPPAVVSPEAKSAPPAAPQSTPSTSPSAATSAAPSTPQGAAGAQPPAPNGVAGLPDVAAPTAPTERRPEAPADKGAFDIVRVEPSGESVIAGRCPAGCSVELLANGRAHDRTVADAAGSWAMTPAPLAPGDYELGLRIRTPDGREAVSDQTVTVSVPKPPSKDVVVVLNEPGAPSRVLARPEAPQSAPEAAAQTAAKPAPVGTTLAVGAVDAENGRFFVQGTAPVGAKLRIYLNGSFIAAPTAGPDGAWSLKVERGLAPGDYDLRVDQVEDDAGKVAGRAQAKFAYRAEAATAQGNAATPLAPEAPQSGASADANAVVAALDSVTVKRGDSLWGISRRSYGAGQRYTVIFAANGGQIRNPDLIYPGQVFVVPAQQAGGK